MLVALSAVAISLCALIVSIQEVRIMRQQQKVSMYPYLSVKRSYTAEGFGIYLKNSGTGLAKVNSIEVYEGDQYFTNALDIVQKKVPDSLAFGYEIIRANNVFNEVVTPNESICLFAVPWNEVTRALEAEMRDFNIRICYSSLLDDYWVLENDDHFELEEPCKPASEKQFK